MSATRWSVSWRFLGHRPLISGCFSREVNLWSHPFLAPSSPSVANVATPPTAVARTSRLQGWPMIVGVILSAMAAVKRPIRATRSSWSVLGLQAMKAEAAIESQLCLSVAFRSERVNGGLWPCMAFWTNQDRLSTAIERPFT